MITPTSVPCGYFDNDSIRVARDLWFSDRKSAEAKYGGIGSWGTCEVTNFEDFFYDTDLNDDISQWDTGRSTSMRTMFYDASSFNADLSGWDVTAVRWISGMFMYAKSFNGDLTGWNVDAIQSMRSMFYQASSFNGDLSRWDVTAVTSMWGMFYGAFSFNGDLSGWNLTAARRLSFMFHDATSFNRCLMWDIKGKDTDDMFTGSNGRICQESSNDFTTRPFSPTGSLTDLPTPLQTTHTASVPADVSMNSFATRTAICFTVFTLVIFLISKCLKYTTSLTSQDDDDRVNHNTADLSRDQNFSERTPLQKTSVRFERI